MVSLFLCPDSDAELNNKPTRQRPSKRERERERARKEGGVNASLQLRSSVTPPSNKQDPLRAIVELNSKPETLDPKRPSPNKQDAQRAIVELNDTELMGRLIFVREDREVMGGGGGGVGFGGGGSFGGGGGGGGMGRMGGVVGGSRRVFVSNLSWQVQWQDLKVTLSHTYALTHSLSLSLPLFLSPSRISLSPQWQDLKTSR